MQPIAVRPTPSKGANQQYNYRTQITAICISKLHTITASHPQLSSELSLERFARRNERNVPGKPLLAIGLVAHGDHGIDIAVLGRNAAGGAAVA